MQTHPTASPARADACTPLQRVIHGAPLAECLSADFKKRTLTFKLEDHQRTEGGTYHLVPAIVAQIGIEQVRAESAGALSFPSPGKLEFRPIHLTRELGFSICGEHGYDHTFYHRRTDSTARFPKPDHWSGRLDRQDSEGNVWSTRTGMYVTDNYGELVKVAE